MVEFVSHLRYMCMLIISIVLLLQHVVMRNEKNEIEMLSYCQSHIVNLSYL